MEDLDQSQVGGSVGTRGPSQLSQGSGWQVEGAESGAWGRQQAGAKSRAGQGRIKLGLVGTSLVA